LLKQMLNIYKSENHGTDTKCLILALAFHHRIAWIYPFLDGNGRTLRETSRIKWSKR